MCFAFQRGKCRHGAKCKYTHIRDTETTNADTRADSSNSRVIDFGNLPGMTRRTRVKRKLVDMYGGSNHALEGADAVSVSAIKQALMRKCKAIAYFITILARSARNYRNFDTTCC